MWIVTYSDGSKDSFSGELTLEMLCAYVDDRKKVVTITLIKKSRCIK